MSARRPNKNARTDHLCAGLSDQPQEANGLIVLLVFICPQPKETRMALSNLIDLIAEVAAKQTAREGKTKEETPGSVLRRLLKIWTRLWRSLP
jgi:hypothetical protein